MRHLPAITLVALVPACAYDWTIAPLADAGPGGGSSSSTTSTGSMPSCATLLADLNAARTAAKTCTLGAAGQCTASIVDECHCTSYVTAGGSAQALAFAAAVQKVEDAGCTSSCSTCLPSAGACLLVSGMGPYCEP